jgi:hypothetical protein
MVLQKMNIYVKKASTISCLFIVFLLVSFCSSESGIQPFQDNDSQDVAEWRIFLKPLLVLDHSSDYITMRKPDFTTDTTSLAGVFAYIGLSEADSTNYPGIDPISAEGMNIMNYLSYKMDVSYSDFIFDELKPNVNYKIIVVARNTNYYSVRQVEQRTDSTIPDLDKITIGGATATSITIKEPSFKSVIIPAPQVDVYIGLFTGDSSGIRIGTDFLPPSVITSENPPYSSIVNFVVPDPPGANTNVDTGDPDGICFFSNLEEVKMYKIIVVAHNEKGYQIRVKDQSTAETAPVLEPDLILNNYTLNSLTLEKPELDVFGNPSPTVIAYIGINGVISVTDNISNCVVSDSIAVQSVFSSGYEFEGLIENNTYKVIVVAKNSKGCDSIEGFEKIDGTPPTLLSFYVETWESASITISQPLFDDPPSVPEATLTGYVGYNGTINASGNDTDGYTVTGVLDTIDIIAGEKTFTGLSPNRIYKIYVVAENQAGSSVIDTLWSL